MNFWAEYVDAKIQGRPLSSFRPFTSKDCDIWVSADTWKALKVNPAIQHGSSPTDGQLGIFKLSENPPRVVDILSSVYGVDVKYYPRLQQRALDDGMVLVIDPIYLFLSKCHCYLHLPQAGRQDGHHVRLMAIILPEYVSLLHENANQGGISYRSLLREIKLLRKISSSGPCRRAMQSLKIEIRSLIPWEILLHSPSVLLAKYSASQSNKDE